MDEKMEIIYKINIGLEIIVIVGYEIASFSLLIKWKINWKLIVL